MSAPQALQRRRDAIVHATNPDLAEMSPHDVKRLVHELRVYQAELEAQNDELRRAQAELELSRDRFNDLYDFAPIGYATLDVAGRIYEANLTLAAMLGTERRQLLGVRFSRFVTSDSQECLHQYLQHSREDSATQRCELTLRRADGSAFPAQLAGTCNVDPSLSTMLCRIVIFDITERKQAEEQVQDSLREKEVLLREIHHRVKNNLQVISSLISLQAEGQSDPRVGALFKDIRDRVRSIALVHERLYGSERLAMIDFDAYARSLLGYLFHAHGGTAGAVRLTFRIQPISLPLGAAVYCGLILNELANNALKYAFRGRSSGELLVGLEKDEVSGAVCLRVRDSGVGLPAGFDWRSAPSLGLRLVQMLTRQLHGTVEASSGPGTEFRIRFSLSGDLLAL